MKKISSRIGWATPQNLGGNTEEGQGKRNHNEGEGNDTNKDTY